MIYALLCEMLPNTEGIVKVVMHRTTFTTQAEADKEQRQLRRQNLPFRAWVVAFEDPRQQQDND